MKNYDTALTASFLQEEHDGSSQHAQHGALLDDVPGGGALGGGGRGSSSGG